MCLSERVPGGLISEEGRAKDLCKRAGAEQVGRRGLAHAREVAQQALQGQPILRRKSRGAGDEPQVMGAFVCTLHLCENRHATDVRSRPRSCSPSHIHCVVRTFPEYVSHVLCV